MVANVCAGRLKNKTKKKSGRRQGERERGIQSVDLTHKRAQGANNHPREKITMMSEGLWAYQ